MTNYLLNKKRIFYLISTLLILTLLIRNPIILFLSACFSSITLPIYRKIKNIIKRILRKNKGYSRFKISVLSNIPILFYSMVVISSIVAPIATLILLVSPQAKAGLAKLHELQQNHFALPYDWVELINQFKELLSQYPFIEKLVNDCIENINELITTLAGIAAIKGLKFLGGSMTLLWGIFLLSSLTVLFTAYNREIRTIFINLLNIKMDQFQRIFGSVQKALNGIVMGVIFVAII